MRVPAPNPLKTRSNLQEAFRSLEAPLLAAWKPDATAPVVGGYRAWYGLQPSHLEIVARYLWGLVPYAAGGGESPGWTHVLDAIMHGTDPQHPDYWGPAGENDQRSVEMAAFGLALRLVPDKIWEPLPADVKDRFAGWLGAMTGKGLVNSNWQFFRLMVGMGLRHIGRAPADLDARETESIKKIDSYYLDHGWYADGVGGQRDYYIPMAFHFYGTLLATLSESAPIQARADEWKTRAKQFGESFVHWFADDGSAIAFGRSLTYRFAEGAYWGGRAIAGIDGFAPGELKGLLLRHLRWWWAQPILTADGFLSLGYAYPNLNMLEPYNASGSPYWAFKAFAALMLPESHAFWKDDEKPWPKRPTPSVQPEPCFLIERDAKTGHVLVLSAGQYHPGWPLRHRNAKYAKLAYSTFFGPTVGTNPEWLADAGIDGTIAVQRGASVKTDGTLWQTRGLTANRVIAADHVAADWSPFEGVTIRTWLVPAGDGWHVRLHRVQADQPIQFAEGGFAALDPGTTPTKPEETAAATGERLLATGTDGGKSGLVNLLGKRQPVLNDVQPNTSLYFSRVQTPTITTSISPGTTWLATAVFGASAGSDASWEQQPTAKMEGESTLTVGFSGRAVAISLRETPTTGPSTQSAR